MRPLSAIDAISPAWVHTRELLWRPRRFGLLLKIGLVAWLANLSGFNFSSNNNMSGPMRHGAHTVPPAMIAAIVAGILLVGVVLLALWLVIFYVGSRMQFVLLEVVLRRDTTIGPIWRRYHAATWRWIGLKLAYAAVALLVMAPLLVPMVLHVLHTLPKLDTHNPQQFLSFIAGMLGFGVTLFVIGLLLGAAYRLLASFGLPSMALESTSLGETVRRVASMAQAEPGPVFLYLLMNLVLGMAGGFLCVFAIGMLTLICLVPLGGLGAALWFGLHHAGTVGHVVMGIGLGGLGVLLLAILFVVAVILFGYMTTFLQAYALYFLGGRYPLVGAYLEPLLPPAPAYYPADPGFVAPPAS